MPAPVINPQSSVPGGLRVGQPFEFGLALAVGSDAATAWAVLDNLPTGLSLNTTTGRVTGIPAVAGVFEVRFTATGTSGTSTAVTVAFGVEALPYVSAGVMEIDANIDTGVVWNPRITNGGAPLWGTFGDKKVISLGLKKSGILQDLNVYMINVLLRHDDETPPFMISTGAWARTGAGDNTRYNVLLDLGNSKIAEFMADWDGASTKGGFVFCEIEVIVFAPIPGGSGNVQLPLSFRKAVFELQDDLN